MRERVQAHRRVCEVNWRKHTKDLYGELLQTRSARAQVVAGPPVSWSQLHQETTNTVSPPASIQARRFPCWTSASPSEKDVAPSYRGGIAHFPLRWM